MSDRRFAPPPGSRRMLLHDSPPWKTVSYVCDRSYHFSVDSQG